MAAVRIPSSVNPDLQKERETRSFSVEALSTLIHGGAARAARRRRVLDALFSEPKFQNLGDRYLLSYEERYEASIQNSSLLIKLAQKHGWTTQDYNMAADALRFESGISVHYIMFIPALEQLGTAEQAERWVPDARALRIVGTYGQTEMGHGTNLRRLQTRADYDPETQEFILNTPLPAGMKWWPGGLGKSCNHLLLLAQLHIKGKSYGMQAFMVQIRDMDTHQSLPGVQVGDIGPRISGIPSDNGFLILRNVRIPRENMLARNAEVTRDGTFVRHNAGSKANYSTMMFVRAAIVSWSFMFSSYSATVATRYSAVRRQSELQPGKPEVQILDFQTQQYKLFPNIALAYACMFASHYMFKSYEHITEMQIQRGDYSRVAELHAESSGLKAYTTETALEATEILRRSCGGHGFLLSSGIGPMVADATSSVTVEGENTVLYQQLARFLLRSFAGAMAGEKQGHSTEYLRQPPPPCTATTQRDLDNLPTLTQTFLHRAHWEISRVALRMQTALSSGVPQYEAWNLNCVDLVRAAKAHVEGFVTVNFADHVSRVESADIRRVLSQLCQLHGLHRIVVSAGDFLQSGAVSMAQLEMIREKELKLLSVIRPEAVSLVDAFDYYDQTLMSTLGSYDGNVYERLFLMAQRSPLNKSDVNPAFHKYIRPLQQAAKL